ncbi:DinB family protein [Tamlana sp. 2201CG12-4]|uniref:DinB family protein n=1 Tax=Tamlana sp. 2201CG12-4 TaxID=3112582 RepID=UPI002DB701D4|nr:DinB family protein [Tamlana sp. 2201CG12-4]MEC3908559.1 DinB family protein [Tamlana sp. 2201CG12-4]
MTIKEVKQEEYNPYYSTYMNKVPKDYKLIEAYELGLTHVVAFFRGIPEDKLRYCYAEDKWSIKEVFQHIIDTERVFIYRCFRISRHDTTPLAGFDQNDYIKPSRSHKKTLELLIEEYQSVRNHSITFLKSLSDDDLKFIGNANGSPISARAAAFSVIGHEIHHIDILKDRYLT